MSDGARQRRRELNRARKDVEAELSREIGDYTPPERSDCAMREWWTTVDDSATLRISIWTWRYEGRLVDFLMRIETGDWTDPDDWTELARIDCSGGRCHVHPPDDTEKHELIHRLDTVEDVEIAFGLANGVANTVAIMIRDRRS